VVCRKGRLRGSKNKAKGHRITATRRDPSQFEYAPSSSAPAVLRSANHQPIESVAVLRLMDANDEEESNEFVDIDNLIDPQLKIMSTTQLGLSRIEESSDTYYPSTLPPRLYQGNPFSRGLEDDETGTIAHELTSTDVALTAEEMEAMANEEEERELLRAIETIRATTTASRAVKATPKAIQHQADMGNQGGHCGGHRGGHRGGNWGGKA
jgi:hypothetical protein